MPEDNGPTSDSGDINDTTSLPPASGTIGSNGEPRRDASANKPRDGIHASTQEESSMIQSLELTPPPLPPRPPLSQAGSLRLSSRSSRPQLLSTPTTALSRADVHSQTHGETNDLRSPSRQPVSRKQSLTHFGRLAGNNSHSDGDDSASLRSYVPTLDTHLDTESIMGDVGGDATWSALHAAPEGETPFEHFSPEDDSLSDQIQHEFDEMESVNSDGSNEELLLADWKAKLKHFFILSASGKPVYSRHGDDQLISNYVGVAQTLISFHQGLNDSLKGFTAGGTRFVILSKGPLNLVAISRLPESDGQLRTQLESLYMQILSTLTLPSMERMFSNRPSTDLRRPLQGTEVLLDGLADGFTRGSPSTLLSALECLRLRKTQRRVINETLLKVRSPNLLYGLIVGAGRLISVVRPKKHSLHPGDLHLIFNMLFEAGSVKAGGGENWIPVCLPGFNNTGFLYMYVSFFTAEDNGAVTSGERPSSIGSEEELAIVLISAKQDAFFEMRTMRDDLVAQLETNGSIADIKTAIRRGHAPCSAIVPGTVLRHFLYKSRGNVQFVMPSFPSAPGGGSNEVMKRRIMSLYHQLHESIHSRTAHLKVQHRIASDSTAVAWETNLFELYCIAGPNASRAALAYGANRVVQWIRREEERVFIIGGAVW